MDVCREEIGLRESLVVSAKKRRYNTEVGWQSVLRL